MQPHSRLPRWQPRSWIDTLSRHLRRAVTRLRVSPYAEERALLRTLYDTLPMAAWIIDEEGRYLTCNAELCRWMKLPKERLEGRLVREALTESGQLTPATIDALCADNERALRRGRPTAGEVELELRNGRRLSLEFRAVPIQLDGRTGLLALASDNSHARLAEQQRKAHEAHLRLTSDVFRYAQVGIVIIDEQRFILHVNPMFERLSGFTSAELLGRDLLTLGLADDLDPATIMPSLLAGQAWRHELTICSRDGSAVDLQVTVSGVRNEDGWITRYVLLLTDITDLKLHQQRLERMAHYDPLTGLANRALFADRLQQAMAASQRTNQLLAVCYLDLDGFKPVNDRYGHPAGDELLVQVAKRLRAQLREADTVARLGGDEFALLLTELGDVQSGKQALDRLLTALKTPFELRHGRTVSISASIGVTLFPNDSADAENLLRHADQAMYLAKQGGRNRYLLFDPELDRQAQALQLLRVRLEDALQHGELELHYQPKVDLPSGRVVGAEALLRWNDPAHGLIPPGEFLPALDGGPLTQPLGDWVIRTALLQIIEWRAAGLQLPVSVNISANHLQQPDFAPRLAALLAELQVSAHLLELEVLESTALDDIDAVCQIMHEVRQLGVSFALDDFGTGYSSLAYLQRLPIQTLKIDQRFVREMLDETASLAIVEGIMGLARPFGLRVIAEGVETEAQGLQLLRSGCTLAQGFGIARPMPPARLIEWAQHYQPPASWLLSRQAPALLPAPIEA